MPQYLAAPPEAQVTRWQLGPPMQRPPVQTPSPAQAPHSSEPPLQPLPILPQYWPPAGAQVVDGVQAASLLPPPSMVITGVLPPVPAVALVPPIPLPPLPAAPTLPPLVAAPPWLPAVPDVDLTPAEQPSEAASAAPRTRRANPAGRRIRTILGLSGAPKTALSPGPIREPFRACKATLPHG